MKKSFNFFLSALTLVTNLSIPTNVVAEEIPTATSGTDIVQDIVKQETNTDASSTPSATTEATAEATATAGSEETANPSAVPTEASKVEEVLDIVDEDGGDDDTFTYSVDYAEDYSKATVKISYTKEEDVYLDLGNADDFAELAEADKFVVNEEQTSDLVLAFDTTENGSYVFKVVAYSNEDDSEVATGEKSIEITDIGKKVEPATTDVEISTDSIMEKDVTDLVKLIKSGKTLAFMIGNEDSDEIYQRTIVAYATLAENLAGQTDTTFVKVTSADDSTIKALTALTMDTTDSTNIVAAYNDLVKGSTGHSVVGFVYNKYITSTVRETGDTDEYTVEEQASRDWSVKYIHSSDNVEKETEETSEDGIMLAKDNTQGNPSVEEGDSWEYEASGNNYQEFTAPESGLYHITLWGADGDSDTGNWTDSYINDKQPATTTGIGGQAGTVKGYVHLDKGQTIYLSLGYRNGMSGRVIYGGGGAGQGKEQGYRSGGGGAGAIYLSKVSGNGELTNYKNAQDQILMVAGGGGGAEDFYSTTKWNSGYYCASNVCINSRGGNGGKNPTSGTSTGPVGDLSGNEFGLGQDYNSWDNSSSGGGGAGLMGGLAGNGQNNTLKGGTGAGGSSYINEALVSGAEYVDGTELSWHIDYSHPEWADLTVFDDGRNAGAIIELSSLDSYKLTINYKDVYTEEKICDSYVGTYKYGQEYSVDSTTGVEYGYNLAEKSLNDAVVSGTMPAHDVEIDVWYDYPRVVVHYKEWLGSEEKSVTIADDQILHIPVNTEYNIYSWIPSENTDYTNYPDTEESYKGKRIDALNGYEFYKSDAESKVVSGTKTVEPEEYTIYYVKKWEPTKHIVAVNGIAITEDQCEKGVELKVGDIVTYEIRYENRRAVGRTETITDKLPSSLKYVEGSATNTDTQKFSK